jgi:hypothetical protein
MKVALILIIVVSSSSYKMVKVPFISLSATCDEMFNQTVKFVKKKHGNYAEYKGWSVAAHYCLDKNNNFYLGYNG